MPILFRDFETKGTLSLNDVGAWKYAAHPETGIWCCAYAVDNEAVKLWTPGDPIPPEYIEAAQNPDWLVSAFNDGFERQIEAHIMAPRYGWPTIPIERHRCSQAAALALSLPAKLETVALALGLAEQKDEAGHATMLAMSKPRKPRKIRRDFIGTMISRAARNSIAIAGGTLKPKELSMAASGISASKSKQSGFSMQRSMIVESTSIAGLQKPPSISPILLAKRSTQSCKRSPKARS